MTVLEKNRKLSEARSESPDPVDIHVGARLRMRRNLVGLSQGQLGKAIGLTFQQIQKYERGINRMGASRLYQMARLLSVPVAYFFDELPANSGFKPQAGFAEVAQTPLEGAPSAETPDYDVLKKRETLELVRAYYRIHDPKQRRKVFELVRSMADESEHI
jgi:transcriptional regulator with XRE-family HTH domain